MIWDSTQNSFCYTRHKLRIEERYTNKKEKQIFKKAKVKENPINTEVKLLRNFLQLFT